MRVRRSFSRRGRHDRHDVRIRNRLLPPDFQRCPDIGSRSGGAGHEILTRKLCLHRDCRLEKAVISQCRNVGGRCLDRADHSRTLTCPVRSGGSDSRRSGQQVNQAKRNLLQHADYGSIGNCRLTNDTTWRCWLADVLTPTRLPDDRSGYEICQCWKAHRSVRRRDRAMHSQLGTSNGTTGTGTKTRPILAGAFPKYVPEI